MPMWHIQHLGPGGISEKASKGNRNYSYSPRDVSLARCASCHQVSLGRSRLWYRTQSDVDPFSSVNLSKLKIRKNLFTKISFGPFLLEFVYLFLPHIKCVPFLSDPGKPGVRSLGPDVCLSVTPTPCVDLTDVTLADEDTNSILTDNANRAIQGNVAMQVTQPGGQLCKQCKWRHLMTKCWTNPSCATWWPNMQLMQVAPSGGQIYN